MLLPAEGKWALCYVVKTRLADQGWCCCPPRSRGFFECLLRCAVGTQVSAALSCCPPVAPQRPLGHLVLKVPSALGVQISLSSASLRDRMGECAGHMVEGHVGEGAICIGRAGRLAVHIAAEQAWRGCCL